MRSGHGQPAGLVERPPGSRVQEACPVLVDGVGGHMGDPIDHHVADAPVVDEPDQLLGRDVQAEPLRWLGAAREPMASSSPNVTCSGGPVGLTAGLGRPPTSVSGSNRYLGLGDPPNGSQRLDQVIDLAGRHPMRLGLHDHGIQRPVDAAAAPTERGRKPPPAAWGCPLRHRRPAWRTGGAGSRCAAHPALSPLVTGGPDLRGGLGVKQRLEHPLQARTDLLVHVARLERSDSSDRSESVKVTGVSPCS